MIEKHNRAGNRKVSSRHKTSGRQKSGSDKNKISGRTKRILPTAFKSLHRPRTVYEIMGQRGEGAQAFVMDVKIVGNQKFAGYKNKITHAVLKIPKRSKNPQTYRDTYTELSTIAALENEQRNYQNTPFGIAKMLDYGTFKINPTENPETEMTMPFIVLEELQQNPRQIADQMRKTAAELQKKPRLSEKEKLHLEELITFAPEYDQLMDVPTSIEIFANLLGGLKYIHRKGLVLIDIKPDNIMFRMKPFEGKTRQERLNEYVRRIATGAYEPVFVDLGCAQNRGKLYLKNGDLAEIIGTPLYLPPEAIKLVTNKETEKLEMKPGHYSPATDVWALTLVFNYFLTGEEPYHGRLDPNDLLEVYHTVSEQGMKGSSGAGSLPISFESLDKLNTPGWAKDELKKIFSKLLVRAHDLRPDPGFIIEEMLMTPFKLRERFPKKVQRSYDDGKGSWYYQDALLKEDVQTRLRKTGTHRRPDYY